MNNRISFGIVMILFLISTVYAQGKIIDLIVYGPIPDFVAGESVSAEFSFNYPDKSALYPYQVNGAPLIIVFNISSNNSEYPVWKGDFAVNGVMNDIYDFNCVEDAFIIDYISANIQIPNIPNGTFYCSDKDLLAMDLNSRNEIVLNFESHPALWPGKYNFSIDLYYPEEFQQENLIKFVYVPQEDKIYDDDRIEIQASSDFECDWYVMDMNDRRPKFKRMCRDEKFCSKKLSFDEGENSIVIKAVDELGNSAEVEKSFRVDSKKPKIYKTYPKRGFANGVFEIEFKEENPETLVLHYGGKEKEINVKACANCRKKGKKTFCSVEVDVSEFDGKRIPYWFVLEDVAGSKDESKKIYLNIVAFAPEISCSSPIDNKVYGSKRQYIRCLSDKDVDWYYKDLNDRRPKFKRMCKDEKICKKRVGFNEGFNDILLRGETAELFNEERIQFRVDSKDPRISKTKPRRGFSDGNFYIEFKEENPKKLSFYYGNSVRNKNVDIDKNCKEKRGKYSCSVWVNLSDFDNKKIWYWFELIDIAGNKDESKKRKVDVDMTNPVLNNPDSFFELDGKYIYFDISITEKNFDKAVLSYEYKGRTKEKRLCSRLRHGKCEKKIRIKDSYKDLKVVIRDEAGNAISERVEMGV